MMATVCSSVGWSWAVQGFMAGLYGVLVALAFFVGVVVGRTQRKREG